MTLEDRIEELIEELGTDNKTLLTILFGTPLGTLADLGTTVKTSIVAAINELETELDAVSGTIPDATETVKGVGEVATLAEMATGTSHTNIFATPAGVRQERDALKAELLGGANASWDTLQELRTAIEAAEESDVISALTTTVGLKANSADVYLKTEIDAKLGNTDADLVALYTAAKA